MENRLSAEQIRKAEAIYRLDKKLRLTFEVLDSDLKFAEQQWAKDESSQFWRRTLVRCFCAHAEGVLSLLKSAIPDIADYFRVSLNGNEFEIVTERRANNKPAYLSFRENVKETLKIYAKAHTTQIIINYNEPGFDDLCNTFEIRNKLMHPKKLFDLEVSDAPLNAAFRGEKWFATVLTKLLNECVKQRPFPPAEQN